MKSPSRWVSCNIYALMDLVSINLDTYSNFSLLALRPCAFSVKIVRMFFLSGQSEAWVEDLVLPALRFDVRFGTPQLLLFHLQLHFGCSRNES